MTGLTQFCTGLWPCYDAPNQIGLALSIGVFLEWVHRPVLAWIGRMRSVSLHGVVGDNFNPPGYHWDLSTAQRALLDFTRRAIGLRKVHPALRRTRFFDGVPGASGLKDLAWFRP